MPQQLMPDAPTGTMGDAPDRVLIAGDWHGNIAWAIQVLKAAHQQGISHVLHLGDFGYWHGPKGAAYLKAVNAQLALYGQVLHFVDGNHEDFDELLELPVDPDTGVRPVLEGGRIFHLPRGFRWQWAGRTRMAVGGATSLDRKSRVAGLSWWPQEELTDDDVRYATEPSRGPVDVMLTHDVPAGVDIPGLADGWDPHELRRAQDNHKRMRQIVDQVRPELLLHGHFHVRYDGELGYPNGRPCRVVGLDCDGGQLMANTVVVDTATLEIRPADTARAATLDRVREAMEDAGIKVSDIEPDMPDGFWCAGMADALAGYRPFTSLHLALIAEACAVRVELLLGLPDLRPTVIACRREDIDAEG